MDNLWSFIFETDRLKDIGTFLGGAATACTAVTVFARWLGGKLIKTIEETLMHSCPARHEPLAKRVDALEYDMYDKKGYVRSRFHEIANKAQIKLSKREFDVQE